MPVHRFAPFHSLSILALAGAACLPVAQPEICTSGVDEDLDALSDCEDPDCAADAACTGAAEDCAAPGDEDGDGLTDCVDPDCAADPLCLPGSEDCAAPGDEDGDALADCADPDCVGDPACAAVPEDCAAPGDEDGDGAENCGDSDCAGDPACAPPPEDCSAVGDEDGDGAADCADADCAGDPGCAVTGTGWTRSLSGVSTALGEQYALVPGAGGLYLVGVPDTLLFAPADGSGVPGAAAGIRCDDPFAMRLAVVDGPSVEAVGVRDGEVAAAHWGSGAVGVGPDSFVQLDLARGDGTAANSSDPNGAATSSGGRSFVVGSVDVPGLGTRGFITARGAGADPPAYFGESGGNLLAVAPSGAGVVAVGGVSPDAAGGSSAIVLWTDADGTVVSATAVEGGTFESLDAVAPWGTASAAAGTLAGSDALTRFSGPGTLEWAISITRTDGDFAAHSLFEDGGELVAVGTVFDWAQNDPKTAALRFDSTGALLAAREYSVFEQEQGIAAAPWGDGFVFSSRGYGGDVWFAGTDSADRLGTCAGDAGNTLASWSVAPLVVTTAAYSAFTLGQLTETPIVTTWTATTEVWAASCP